MEGTSKSLTSSEEVKVEEDRLSFLPAEIRYHILSFLPTHEAFKTSLLSRLWSAMWPSLPVLIFDYRIFPEVDNKLECFLDFIRQTVARHDETSLKAFLLYFWPPCDRSEAPIESEWVTFAVEHNVQNIALSGELEEEQKIPDSLFTCSSIVTLGLSVTTVVLEWPVAAALPNLKKLVIIDMYISGNFTMGLSSICPQLETLFISFCDLSAYTVFSVENPSLKYLTVSRCQGIERCEVQLITPSLEKLVYTGGIARDYKITHSDSLSFARIEIIEVYPTQTRDACYLPAIKFARGVRHAKRLMFNELFIKFIKDEHPARLLGNMSFDKVEELLLRMWPTREQVLTTFLLLSRCAGLTLLGITITKPHEPTQDLRGQDQSETPCLLNGLKTLKIIDFGGSESEMELVRICLQNGPSLSELKIEMAKETNDSGTNSLRLTANQMKDKILEMLKLARSSSITVSFS